MAVENNTIVDSYLDSNIASGLESSISGDDLNIALKKITESYYNKVDDPLLDNGYTIFGVWAEENGNLAAGNSFQWGYGNAAVTAAANGIVIPIDCELFAMGLNVEASDATVQIAVNGETATLTDYQVFASAPSGFATFANPLKINAGDTVNFMTVTSSGAEISARASAFFKVSSGSSNLSNLTDVNIQSPESNQILMFDGTDWVNGSVDYHSLTNLPSIVTADGSVSEHSDVDITTITPQIGDELVWNDTHFIPKQIPNANTVFGIWAEEAADLTGGESQEWAFGNGDNTPESSGIVVPIDCELFGMGLNVEGGSATVRIVIDGDTTQSDFEVTASAPSGFITFGTPLQITAGSVINFRTISSTESNTQSGRISAFFKVSSENDTVLNDLLDVNITSADTNQIIQYDGTNWVNRLADYQSLANAPSLTGGVSMNEYDTLSSNNNQVTINTTGFRLYSAHLQLTENVTLDISGQSMGDYGTIIIDQDASGNNTVTLPTANSKVVGDGGSTFTPAANERMILSYFYDGEFNWNVGENYGLTS